MVDTTRKNSKVMLKSRCSLMRYVCIFVTLHRLRVIAHVPSSSSSVLVLWPTRYRDFLPPHCHNSRTMPSARCELHACRRRLSAIVPDHERARPNLQRHPVHHYDMTWHGPYSSLVRLTGANAQTQSLSQMRYQMATLISACMTGTWVGRYPLCPS